MSWEIYLAISKDKSNSLTHSTFLLTKISLNKILNWSKQERTSEKKENYYRKYIKSVLYLCFFQFAKHIPKIFGKLLPRNWNTIYSKTFSNFNQMWWTTKMEEVGWGLINTSPWGLTWFCGFWALASFSCHTCIVHGDMQHVCVWQ